MKKTLFLILFLILGCSLFAADFAHYMIGHVGTVAEISLEIDESVIPFNLDSPDIRRTGSGVQGLRIGSYTFVTNSDTFELIITHTPFSLKSTPGANDPGTLSQINYRLYTFLQGTLYESCLGTSDSIAKYPETAGSEYRIRIAYNSNQGLYNTGTNDYLSIVNQSIYVNLEDNTEGSTENTVAALKSGMYESKIYFLVKGM